ncbi:hypothetical protein D3C76_1701330 [compost metagenome]
MLESLALQRRILLMQTVTLHSIEQPRRCWNMLHMQAAQACFIEACSVQHTADYLVAQLGKGTPKTP